MADDSIRILLAEDDNNLGLLLTDFLSSNGCTIILVADGQKALEVINQQQFDLYLFDIMMPKMDGFELTKTIRKTGNTTPVVFITARPFKADKLKGYGLGADDYITKPFDEDELLWKIKAVVRRSKAGFHENKKETVVLGKYMFDYESQSLSINGQLRRITEKENEILWYLCSRRNHIIKREEMLENLWGKNDYFLGRSLDVFITKIRKYLSEDESISIENIFGVGFIFNVPE